MSPHLTLPLPPPPATLQTDQTGFFVLAKNQGKAIIFLLGSWAAFLNGALTVTRATFACSCRSPEGLLHHLLSPIRVILQSRRKRYLPCLVFALEGLQ